MFTYDTTGTPGYFSLRSLTSAPVMDSASEHPADISGINTFLSGFNILAVSAMKCTPHIIIVSAFAFCDSFASNKLSPTMSATQ